MECLLCHFYSGNISELKDHYGRFHVVNNSDSYFLDLFQPDTLDRKCSICSIVFPTCRIKKNHIFLYHYNQLGGVRNAQMAPSNTLKRGIITYYSVNFQQHDAYYDFYSSDMIDVFLNVVHDTFVPQRNLTYKFQAYFEIVNKQRTPDNNDFLTDNRTWLTNVFRFKYFNEFVKGEIRNEITKRIINNGQLAVAGILKDLRD